MRNFRLLPVVAAIAFCSVAICARADDTAAQAAARAALMQKMDQLNGGPQETNAPAPAPAQPAMAPQTPPPAAATPPAATATPPPAASASETADQQAAARAALMQKLNELNSQPASAPMTAEQQSALATAGMSQTNQSVASQVQAETNMPPAIAPMAEPPVVVSPSLAAPPAITNETTQYPVNPANGMWPQGKAAPIVVPPVEQPEPAMQPPGAAPAPAPAPQPVLTPAPSPATSLPSMSPPETETQLTAPPLPISQEKQEELQELLQRYIANQVTPAQYQEERAKIIAQPN